MTKNLDIEVMRAYAITITIVAHLGLLNPTWDSWIGYYWLGGGVDLFFCISGFLITSSLLLSLTRKQPFLTFAGKFWIRRLFRLWPAALLWATVTLIISEVIDVSRTFGPVEDVRLSWLAGVFNVENLVIWWTHTTAKPTPIWHYWSLSLEEQFYIVLPILLFFSATRKYIAIFMLAFAVYQSTHIRPWGELLWFIRSDALIYGSLIAFAWHNHGAQLTRVFNYGKKIYWQLCFALVIPLPVLLSKISATPYYMGLVAVSAGLVILLCSANKDLTGNQNPVKKALVYIGSRSYSIYLIHFPIFAVLREQVLTSGISDLTAEIDKVVATVVAMSATVLLAEFSFRKVETPLRDYGRKLSENWSKRPARETLASSAA